MTHPARSILPTATEAEKGFFLRVLSTSFAQQIGSKTGGPGKPIMAPSGMALEDERHLELDNSHYSHSMSRCLALAPRSSLLWRSSSHCQVSSEKCITIMTFCTMVWSG